MENCVACFVLKFSVMDVDENNGDYTEIGGFFIPLWRVY